MARRKKQATGNRQNDDGLGFEAKLWAAAAAPRKNLDAAEYKHVVFCTHIIG